MQVSPISNNNKTQNFGAFTKFKVRGRDIKNQPEFVEKIKKCLIKKENYPQFCNSNYTATIRSRDYKSLKDMCATQISCEYDKVPRYSTEVVLHDRRKPLSPKSYHLIAFDDYYELSIYRLLYKLKTDVPFMEY